MKGTTIHKDGESELIQLDLKEEELILVVKVVDPSTNDIYMLRVPPEMKRCKQAIAWTFGMEEDD